MKVKIEIRTCSGGRQLLFNVRCLSQSPKLSHRCSPKRGQPSSCGQNVSAVFQRFTSSLAYIHIYFGHTYNLYIKFIVAIII